MCACMYVLDYDRVMMWAAATTTFLSSAGQKKSLFCLKGKPMTHGQIFHMGIYQTMPKTPLLCLSYREYKYTWDLKTGDDIYTQ